MLLGGRMTDNVTVPFRVDTEFFHLQEDKYTSLCKKNTGNQYFNDDGHV